MPCEVVFYTSVHSAVNQCSLREAQAARTSWTNENRALVHLCLEVFEQNIIIAEIQTRVFYSLVNPNT